MLLSALFCAYRQRRLAGASHSTLTQYAVSLRDFERFLGRPTRVADLTDENVQGVVWDLVKRGRSKATANKRRANLLALWRFACRAGHLASWPDVDKLVEPRRIPLAWRREQLRTLYQTCDQLEGFVGGVEASGWWHALHAVVWDTGERISAVLAIRWAFLDRDWLIVPAECRKGRREDKAWHLHPDTMRLLDKIREPARDKVFPWPYHRSTLWNRYQILLKSGGLPADRRHKFHCLRRSVASYYEAAGGNATALLGHSTRSVTIESYLDPRICKTPDPSDLLFRPDDAA